MSARLVAGVAGLFALFALPTSVFVACGADQAVCTPENSGHGADRTLTRRDLPGIPDKKVCEPHLVAITSSDDLRRAYETAGLPISDPDGGTSAPGAIPLPPVDFTKESVIIREDIDTQSLSWLSVNGMNEVTAGTQGCRGAGVGACVFNVVAVDAANVTKASAYSCEDISCGGGGVPGMGVGGGH